MEYKKKIEFILVNKVTDAANSTGFVASIHNGGEW